MRKYLLPIILVCVWSCEEENSNDTVEDTTVTLWGENFSVENTTELNFSHFDNYDNPYNLSGEIPPEIGNLINLTYLNLSGNQLTNNKWRKTNQSI